MNNYKKLRELICDEEEIRNDLYVWYNIHWCGEEFEYVELRHILWYMKSKWVKFDDNWWLPVLSRINYELPLSEQEEACERVYNYLVTL